MGMIRSLVRPEHHRDLTCRFHWPISGRSARKVVTERELDAGMPSFCRDAWKSRVNSSSLNSLLKGPK